MLRIKNRLVDDKREEKKKDQVVLDGIHTTRRSRSCNYTEEVAQYTPSTKYSGN